MAPKAKLVTLCGQKPWMAGRVWPVASQALPCLIRFMAVLLGHEPFLTSVAALAEFAGLLFEELFMLRGVGIVTPRTFKLFKRLMSPFLSQLRFNVRMTVEACFEADRRTFCGSSLGRHNGQQKCREKYQMMGVDSV